MTERPTWMIVGLGNPGKRYDRTRHNIGFMVIDELRRTLPAGSPLRRFDAEIFERSSNDERIVLLKPQTFMNRSGNAVGAAVRWYRVPLENLLVVYDDLDLPFGQLRLRPSGSSGGHNGLGSIINSLGTDQFPRLRLGIGRSERTDAIGYVLSRFGQAEEAQLPRYVAQAAEAVLAWRLDGINDAMNQFNRRATAEPTLGEGQSRRSPSREAS